MSDVETSDVERPGIDRRTLIKRAAATGAVAWTAPLIIDSLASPAAAVTVAAGCYDLFYPINGNTGDCAAAAPTTGCCQPTGFATHTNFATVGPGCITITGHCGKNNSTTTFKMDAGCDCLFVIGRIQAKGGTTCTAGTLGGTPSGKEISFNLNRCDAAGSGFRILVACGGSTACANTSTNTCTAC